jgi:hypothetical protein
MTSVHRLQCVVLGILVSVATASAQTTPPPAARVVPTGNMWSHGTTLNVFGELEAHPAIEAAVAGGAFGWEVRPWFAIEGTGSWLDWGQGCARVCAVSDGHKRHSSRHGRSFRS